MSLAKRYKNYNFFRGLGNRSTQAPKQVVAWVAKATVYTHRHKRVLPNKETMTTKLYFAISSATYPSCAGHLGGDPGHAIWTLSNN